MPNICSKDENNWLFRHGLIGNTLRQWDDVGDFLASGFPGYVMMRSRNMGRTPVNWLTFEPRPSGVLSKRHPSLLWKLKLWSYAAWDGEWWTRDEAYFTEMLPHQQSRVVLQGEVMRDSTGWYLYYSTAKAIMREALRSAPRHATGVAAYTILRDHMDGSSWDCLLDLLDHYDGHVVEFTILDQPCGQRGWNTLFWEVRNY